MPRARWVLAAALCATACLAVPAGAVEVPCSAAAAWVSDSAFYADVVHDVGQVTYVWHAGGHSIASKQCARSVTADVQIVDTATLNRLDPVTIGAHHAATNNGAWSSPYWIAQASARDPAVLELDAGSGYVRGTSWVTVYVRAAYVDRKTGRTVPIPCVAKTWQVTPTTDGPVYGTSFASECAW